METRHVWALAGGKGGAGRTLIAANLGIQLARAGRRVVLIDLDLQGGGLHLALGFSRVRRGLGVLAAGGEARLADLAVDTSINHLRLVGGLAGARPPHEPEAFVRKVASGLDDLDADFVLIDCGSGRAPATLQAFGLASLGILVSTPEPQALESACLFIQSHLGRCLERALPADTRRALDELLAADGVAPERLGFRALMIRLGALDAGARDAVAAEVRRTRLELLLNPIREDSDEEAGAALASGFRKAFGLELPIAGLVEYDPSVIQAVHKRRPLSQQFPNTPATKGIARAAEQMVAACASDRPAPSLEWEDLSAIDHYRVLEIVPKASSREIQTAYHVLRRAYDQETTPLAPVLDTEALRAVEARVEEAYRALIFLESRVAYDRRLLEAGRLGPDEIRGLHAGMPPGGPSAPTVPGLGTHLESPPPPDPTAPASVDTTPAPLDSATEPETVASSPVSPPGPGEPDGASRAVPRPVPMTGEALRAERMRIGQTLEAISARTKIRRTYLQAIEEERFEALPPPVFLRGFVREFAACLGLPGDEVARALLKRREQACPAVATSADPALRSA